jgi:hypothetical protein
MGDTKSHHFGVCFTGALCGATAEHDTNGIGDDAANARIGIGSPNSLLGACKSGRCCGRS